MITKRKTLPEDFEQNPFFISKGGFKFQSSKIFKNTIFRNYLLTKLNYYGGICISMRFGGIPPDGKEFKTNRQNQRKNDFYTFSLPFSRTFVILYTLENTKISGIGLRVVPPGLGVVSRLECRGLGLYKALFSY